MKLSISIHWRRKETHYRLALTKCRACGRVSFGERKVCPYCGSKDVTTLIPSGTGTLLSYSVSYFRREGDEEFLPRITCLVKLDEGAIVPGELVDVDPDEVYIGMKVEAVLRRYSSDDPYGLIYYGLKFIPFLKG